VYFRTSDPGPEIRYFHYGQCQQIEWPKATRGYGCGQDVPLSPLSWVWGGGCAPPQIFFNFSLKIVGLVHFERYFKGIFVHAKREI